MKKEFYLGIRKACLLFLNKVTFFVSKSNNYILCYHSFTSHGNSYSVSPKIFAKHIKNLAQNYNFVSLDEIFKSETRNSIAITVDDGYEDIFFVLPTIEKYKIPLTLFVLANPKLANRQELDHAGKLLTFAQIQQLQRLGVVIGCHSMTHANFAQLNKKELAVEIIDAKKELEKKLNTKVEYFAYPKGIVTNEAVKLVKKACFKAAFTVLPGKVDQDRLLIPRTIIDEFYSEGEINSLFNPLMILLKNMMIKYRLWRFVPNI